jgi:hypothetical protein
MTEMTYLISTVILESLMVIEVVLCV